MVLKNYIDALNALQWHIENGADEMLLDAPVDRTIMPELPKVPEQIKSPVAAKKILNFEETPPQEDIMGAAEAVIEAQKAANSCHTLEDLAKAIQEFNGLSLKKTATNMVFGDGNPQSKIMLIGEAPEGDDDIQGKPFVGASGQLLDKILACIDLGRKAEDLEKSVYMTNVLNWRPPGNRTPTKAEMDISRPFITRHIALVKPKILILCGGQGAQTLLQSADTISKLRGKFHDYTVEEGHTIPACVTYHPAYLLRTPAQKKAVWADMLMFQEQLESL